MKRLLYIFITLALSQAVVLAQNDPPDVKDTQQVKPEDLKGVPAVAPDYKSDNRKLPDIGRVGVDMLEQKPLSLKEAITLGLENNKDIEVSRQTIRSAEFDLVAAGGFFTPRFSGTAYYERATNANLSIFIQTPTTTNNSMVGSLRYDGFIKKYGTSYHIDFNNQRLTTNNTISPLSPQLNSSLGFSLVQPLRRGFHMDTGRRTIEIASRNISLTNTQFRQKSIDVVTAVQRAYWDLMFTLRNLQVQRDGVRDAKDQLEHNKRLVKEGSLAPIDIVAAETQVANLELNLYTALDDVNRAENALKNLISPNRNDKLWGFSLVPVEPVERNAPAITLPEAMQTALENRPELELNETAKEINAIDQRFYKDQIKPQIDFIASYTANGIAGSQNPLLRPPFGNQPIVVPGTLTGNYLSSLSDIVANRYPTFRVGIQFGFPVNNKASRAQLGKSLVEAEKLQTQREQIEQAIQVDVRNTLQSLRTAEARLRAAAIARENSDKQYQSEQRKLNEGQSTVYLVLERQTALVNARSVELRAQTELNKAIVELQRAMGRSLKENNIEEKLRGK